MSYGPSVEITGEGPPLLFVPGIEGTGLLFYRQIAPLARAYRVITFRLRDAAADMDTLVADLDAIVSGALGTTRAGKVTIIGESFGGALALTYALTRPSAVDRLVILNSFAYLRQQARLRLAHRLLRAMPWGVMRIVRWIAAPHMHSPRTDRAEIRKVLALMRHTTREGYLSRLSILQRYDVRPRLGELAIPTLFLAADRDRFLPSVQHAEELASLVPNARLRILTGHGHTCLVAPDLDLSEILKDWADGRG